MAKYSGFFKCELCGKLHTMMPMTTWKRTITCACSEDIHPITGEVVAEGQKL